MIHDASLPEAELQQFQKRSLLVGIVGLALCGAGMLFNREEFFRSYLLAYLFWIGIALGCLAIVMLHHLSGGAWGIVIRRLLESATRTLPLMALLFLPIVFGLSHLYEWARPEALGDKILRHKSLYLNVPFFLVRAALYFAAWIAVVYFLNKWSLKQDQTAAPSLSRQLELLSGPGLVIYGATMTFASIDWVMSLEAHWFSTIYGLSFMVGQVLGAFAFVIAVAILLSSRKPLSEVISSEHLHDLGKLLLAFVMLWAYLAFSQFLIMFSGNLPEEIPWYIRRQQGGWRWIGLLLILLHFALPFLLLLSRSLKRDAKKLLAVAALVIAMRFVDLLWQVSPAFHPEGFHFNWMDLAAPAGIGGIWLASFARQLKGRPVLPLHDPFFQEAVQHGRE
ncbi:MAG: hypothetical protein DMG05_17140 [Acidobacteria bacterium]|nr:MAG: hypothetical protein DMG05_17140 [Acidobacteriota bacterium]